MSNKENNNERQVRAAQLPGLAAKIFGNGKPYNRVRTLMMKVDLSEPALAIFSPLSKKPEDTKKRLGLVTDQWTGAIQHMLAKIKDDLFDKRRDILLSVAAERDFDAVEAEKKGWLDPVGSNYELGTAENPFLMPIFCHYKIGREMVPPGTEKTKISFCAKINDGLFIKLEENKPDKDDSALGNKPDFVIKKFDAQSFGGFLSAAYWSGYNKLQSKSYSFGQLGESYVRDNDDRTRLEWLKEGEFSSGVGESIRQKVAENVCGFLEKYYSVQSEVSRFNSSAKNSIDRTRNFLRKYQDILSEEGGTRAAIWEEAAEFKDCDGRDPVDVERAKEWLAAYNMRTNELWQVLPEELKETAKNESSVESVRELKGYPSWPEYKQKSGAVFHEILEKLEDKVEEISVNSPAVKDWVLRTFVNGEIRRLDYRAGKFRTGDRKRSLPLRVSMAREIFSRTGGKILKEGEKHRFIWNPDSNCLLAVLVGSVERFRKDFQIASTHVETASGREDYFAKRRQVDILVTLANLRALSLGESERPRFLADINRMAGEAKGALLGLAEGTKEEVQIAGFSLKEGKGNSWSLQKNACLLSVKSSDEGRERLALMFDPSGKKEDTMRIETGLKDGILAIGYSGGADKKDSTEDQKSRVLRFGEAKGKLGDYGVVLPLQVGKSQARRYLYPGNGRGGEGIVSAMSNGVNVMSGRIIRKIVAGGQTEFYVALSIGLPRSQYDYRSVPTTGFIGVDRGENHLAVIAETDRNGRLTSAPIGYGSGDMNRTGRAYSRMRRSQSQMKRLKGGSWFEARITNAVRLIAVRVTEMMLSGRKAIVFEDLSRGFGRGGTASWQHQYTKVLDHLRDVLSFCGLMTKEIIHYSDKNIVKGHQWFGVVGAAWTSQTCPSCGTIWGKQKNISRNGGIVTVSWDGSHCLRPGIDIVVLSIGSDSQWFLEIGDRKHSVPSDIAIHCLAYVSESNKASERAKRSEKAILEYLNHRPRLDYETFRCRYCGENLHADKVGAVNIARKAIFQNVHKVEKRKRADWQSWYLKRLEDSSIGWWNAQTREWLKR